MQTGVWISLIIYFAAMRLHHGARAHRHAARRPLCRRGRRLRSGGRDPLDSQGLRSVVADRGHDPHRQAVTDAWALGCFGPRHVIVRFMAVRSVGEVPTARNLAMA
jgi:hypothetical protein